MDIQEYNEKDKEIIRFKNKEFPLKEQTIETDEEIYKWKKTTEKSVLNYYKKIFKILVNEEFSNLMIERGEKTSIVFLEKTLAQLLEEYNKDMRDFEAEQMTKTLKPLEKTAPLFDRVEKLQELKKIKETI